MGGLQRFELRLAGPALLRAVQRAASRPGAENYEKQHSGKHPSGLKAAAAASRRRRRMRETGNPPSVARTAARGLRRRDDLVDEGLHARADER